MNQLSHLPCELLLQISLNTSTRDSDNDTCNLALVSRKFRSIAQEALHTSVLIRDSKDKIECFRMGYLVRTLIERPDLARRVKELEITLMGRRNPHERSCAKKCNTVYSECTCYWEDCKQQCCNIVNSLEAYNKE